MQSFSVSSDQHLTCLRRSPKLSPDRFDRSFHLVAELVVYFVLHIYRIISVMRCNLIFEAARVLQTKYTLNIVLTTWNIGFYFNRFQCKQAESVVYVKVIRFILSIGRKCFISIQIYPSIPCEQRTFNTASRKIANGDVFLRFQKNTLPHVAYSNRFRPSIRKR